MKTQVYNVVLNYRLSNTKYGKTIQNILDECQKKDKVSLDLSSVVIRPKLIMKGIWRLNLMMMINR